MSRPDRRRSTRTVGGTVAGTGVAEDTQAQADSLARPRRRRAFTIACPARVRMRARNPCLRERRRLFGWNVRFTVRPSGTDPGPGPIVEVGRTSVRGFGGAFRSPAADARSLPTAVDGRHRPPSTDGDRPGPRQPTHAIRPTAVGRPGAGTDPGRLDAGVGRRRDPDHAR